MVIFPESGNVPSVPDFPISREHKAKDGSMSAEMDKRKTFRAALWLSILVDAAIVAAILTKISRSGINGLIGWFPQFRLVPVSVTGGQAPYRLAPDYRFTAFYIAVIAAAFSLTVFLVRAYLRKRNVQD